MSNAFESLPDKIQTHLRSIVTTAGLPDTQESLEKLGQGWQEKQTHFVQEIEERSMTEVDTLEQTDTRGAVALTYSGSLVLIGPVIDDARKVGYNSIGIRTDVPVTAVKEGSQLASDINVDQSIEFAIGPVQKTSAIYKIAVCQYDLAPVEQAEVLEDVTIVLADQFAEVNKTIVQS